MKSLKLCGLISPPFQKCFIEKIFSTFLEIFFSKKSKFFSQKIFDKQRFNYFLRKNNLEKFSIFSPNFLKKYFFF